MNPIKAPGPGDDGPEDYDKLADVVCGECGHWLDQCTCEDDGIDEDCRPASIAVRGER